MDEPDVIRTLRSLGLPEESIRRAVKRGDPEAAIFDSVLLPEIAERTVSANEIAARGGPDPEELGLFMEAFGLPIDDPGEPLFSEDEANVFVTLKSIEDVWKPELGIQVARVYGRLLARIAQTELQIFRVFVQPELASDAEPRAYLQAARDLFATLLPISGTLLVGVHRRWLEHHLAQEAVTAAETEADRLPGAVDVAFLFCDLKEFTAYANDRGDTAAVAAIDRFAEVVARERGREVRFVKALGDGFMLVYADAAQAVAAGRRVIDAMRAPGLPLVHASAHRGVAIAREGDYFGGAVNLAARLLDSAAGGELVATEAAVEAAGEQFAWEPVAAVRVRGVGEPVAAFRLLAG